MKELSTEEKAQAYDEALERAQVLYNDKNEIGYANAESVLEEVFPLLKESEDEKIRKELITHCRNTRCVTEEGAKKIAKWIAWLEKQDEQKPADKVEPKFKVKYAGSEYNVFETKDIAGVTFYGIEDEPNHIDYVKAENCEIIGGYGIKENGSLYPTKPAKFSEQNHAWSEEDETMLERVIDFIPQCMTAHGYNEYINWFESLKDRVQPQPKQEWSEEDEKEYKYVLKFVDNILNNCGNKKDYEHCKRCYDWLKSLKQKIGG